MIFRKIQHEKMAEAIVRQIEDLILEGVLRPGDQLPPERDLATQFDVSRPSLRAAIKDLEHKGLLVARHGGGTYVAQVLGSVFSEPITYLFRTNPKATDDYLEFRREFDMIAARYAAERATAADKEILRRVHEQMKAAYESGDMPEAIRLDIEFHITVVEAAHNIVLLHTMRSIYELLVAGVFYDRVIYFQDDDMRHTILEQHQAILDAIFAGDRTGAQAAAERHVHFIEDTLRRVERTGSRAEVSERRLEKLKQRARRSAERHPQARAAE